MSASQPTLSHLSNCHFQLPHRHQHFFQDLYLASQFIKVLTARLLADQSTKTTCTQLVQAPSDPQPIAEVHLRYAVKQP